MAKKAKFSEGTGSFILAIVAILAFRWALFEPYVIPSGSMIPTLLVHDHILVNKFKFGVRIPFSKDWLIKGDDPKRGEIVVFRSLQDSGYFMIKRIVGLPGDTIDVDPDGFLLVNGSKVEAKPLDVTEDPASQKPYYAISEADLGAPLNRVEFFEEKFDTGSLHRVILAKDISRYYEQPLPLKVPEGHYFCMGDNRDNSQDSRYWGTLPRENLLGKAMFVWLSCEETLPYLPFLCNPLKLRWTRFFHGLE